MLKELTGKGLRPRWDLDAMFVPKLSFRRSKETWTSRGRSRFVRARTKIPGGDHTSYYPFEQQH